MLHVATHWPQYADSKFWPQATDYTVWVFNRLPSVDSGIAPNELWSRVQAHGTNMTCAHVFGCPVYILDASLQDGKKIPKWNPRACLGLFLGFSNLHSSQVPLVLNAATGHISPQFHVIFDDKFETLHSLPASLSISNGLEYCNWVVSITLILIMTRIKIPFSHLCPTLSCWAIWCHLSCDVKSAWHRIGAQGARLYGRNS